MSRSFARKNLKKSDIKAHLKAYKVEVIGAGLDEAPMAYKDIHEVMRAQTDLVDVLGSFTPRIVRMDAGDF